MQMINGFFEPDDGGWKERSRVAYSDTKKANNRCSNFSYSATLLMTYLYMKHKITLQKSVKEASIQAFWGKKAMQVQRHSDDRRRNMKATFWKVEKVSETP